MGQAKIISHIADGQYNVQLQYANENMDVAITDLTTKIADYTTQQTDLQSDYDTRKADYDVILDNLVLLTHTSYGLAVEYQQTTVYPAKIILDSVKFKLDVVKLQLESSEKELQKLNAAKAEADQTITAWCAEYNVDLVADSIVGTFEVDYELPTIANQQNWPVVLKSTAPTSQDGRLQSIIASDAWAYLYNRIVSVAMMLAAPRYRVGNVTAKNDDGTLAVEFLPAYASEREQGHLSGFDVTIDQSLDAVVVKYLSCDASAFEIGDAVIVQYPPVNIYTYIQSKYAGLVADIIDKIPAAQARQTAAEAIVVTKQAELDDINAQIDALIDTINAQPDENSKLPYIQQLSFILTQVGPAEGALNNAKTNVSTIQIEIQSLNQLQSQYQVIADTNASKSAAFIMTPAEKTVIGFARNPRNCAELVFNANFVNHGDKKVMAGSGIFNVTTTDLFLNPTEYNVKINNLSLIHSTLSGNQRWLYQLFDNTNEILTLVTEYRLFLEDSPVIFFLQNKAEVDVFVPSIHLVITKTSTSEIICDATLSTSSMPVNQDGLDVLNVPMTLTQPGDLRYFGTSISQISTVYT